MITLIRQMKYAFPYLRAMMHEEDGQDFTEYALILVIVVMVAAAGFTLMGTQISTVAQAVTTWLQGYPAAAPAP